MTKQKPKQAHDTVVYMKDPEDQEPKLKSLGGSNADDFNNHLATSVMRTLWFGNCSKEDTDRRIQAALAAMLSLKPRNEAEGMLIGQMIATHAATMECYRRAMLQDQTFVGRQQNLNFANKLARTYATQLEALDRYRGKGQQTVRVEHVTVNAGGQAIVGNVTGGGGLREKPEDQSHAKRIADAQEPQMRSTLQDDGQALPERSHDERSLPDARWTGGSPES